jgi:Ca2+-transporting ATPase
MRDDWHVKPIAEVAANLASDLNHGLAADEAARRLAIQGPNELRKGERISALALFLGQFRSLVIVVLIGAAVVSAAFGERADGIAIIAIVILNAAVGFFQEYRAEQAVAALARLAAPRARVLRGGQAEMVTAADIVPGDILIFEAGDVVAADGRLLEASALRTNEASLTGESEPVDKQTGECAPGTPLAERTNMIYLATSVAAGTGRALVVATGMDTEVGRIATLLETASSGETPLRRRLDQVARRLLWICSGIVALVFALGWLRSHPAFELFMSAVSLAVAAIPEGLPAVVTIALALGVSRMVRRNALVRRLAAVETLGCAQVICTDKTGTLTVGEMTARKLVTIDRVFSVTGEGYAPEGGIFADGVPTAATEDPVLRELLRAAVACNDARFGRSDGKPSIVGDPTEGALLVVAAKGGVGVDAIESEMPRIGVIPFSSDRKRMTVVRRCDGVSFAFVKGAPEVILDRCIRIRSEHGVREITAADRARMLEAIALMANDALRVIAIAEREVDSVSGAIGEDQVERDLMLLGLIGLQDPPRAEAREAVRKCRLAGIRTVMITGDHPDTARAIARELGILGRGDAVIVGRELEEMSDEELAAKVESVAVYARVTAEHKLRIVRAWKARGAVVAMTGDGVNDAPALKEASIGVAMGITGTEVTKQAADVVITDDNFASIVAAVEEGRGIYDNIVKTLAYLMSGNAGELAVMFVAALVGWPLPLLPIQLLWINLVTDGLPALALATDPIEPDVLQRPPRPPEAQIMDRSFIARIVLTGSLTAAVTLAAFAYEFHVGGDLQHARNAAFSVLVMEELLRSFSARSATRTVWEVGLLSNMRLFVIVAASFALQLAIYHVPVLQQPFSTEPMSATQFVSWLALGATPLVVLEVRKVIRRKFTGKNSS